MYQTKFKVRARIGYRRFPVDMLRYDRCLPATEEDSKLVELSFDDGQDRVEICMIKYHAERSPNLTDLRWQSFGWEITSMTISLVF